MLSPRKKEVIAKCIVAVQEHEQEQTETDLSSVAVATDLSSSSVAPCYCVVAYYLHILALEVGVAGTEVDDDVAVVEARSRAHYHCSSRKDYYCPDDPAAPGCDLGLLHAGDPYRDTLHLEEEALNKMLRVYQNWPDWVLWQVLVDRLLLWRDMGTLLTRKDLKIYLEYFGLVSLIGHDG